MTNYPIDPNTGHAHSHGLTGNHSHTYTVPDVPLKQAYPSISISQEMANDFLARDRREVEATMNQQIDKILKEKYLPALENQLYGRPPSPLLEKYRQEYPTKEALMDMKYLVNDEVAKRKAAKAKKKVKRAYKAFDALGLDDNDYAVWAWSHKFKGNETVFEYAALYTNERWYVTGAKSPNALDTDEFVGWVVGMEFDPDTFVNLA